MVEQWNSGTVEQIWWKSPTVIVERRNSYGATVEQWNRDGGTVEQLWWNSGKEMEEQCNNDGGTVEQI